MSIRIRTVRCASVSATKASAGNPMYNTTSFFFFRSAVHNIPIYITLLYYVYTYEYFVCTILYALVAVLHFARSPPTPRPTIYYIGIGKYAYIAIIYIIVLSSRPTCGSRACVLVVYNTCVWSKTELRRGD